MGKMNKGRKHNLYNMFLTFSLLLLVKIYMNLFTAYVLKFQPVFKRMLKKVDQRMCWQLAPFWISICNNISYLCFSHIIKISIHFRMHRKYIFFKYFLSLFSSLQPRRKIHIRKRKFDKTKKQRGTGKMKTLEKKKQRVKLKAIKPQLL